MPRGRKPKRKFDLNIKPDTAKSFFAVIFILASGLSLISFFTPNYALNSRIQDVLRGLFGWSWFIVPVILFLLGILLIDHIKWKFKSVRVLTGFVVFLLIFSTLFHIFLSSDSALEVAQNGGGGGMLGFHLSQLLKNTISIYGGILLLLASTALAYFLVSNMSIDESWGILDKAAEKLKTLKNNTSVKSAEESQNVLITSGVGTMSDDIEEYTRAPAREPAFEIIPSLSEPLSSQMEMPISRLKGHGHIGPNSLPYSDKVWENPPYDLLNPDDPTPIDAGDTDKNKKTIVTTLKSFGINVTVEDVKLGPAVTQYVLKADEGTKISKIASLQYDLAMALASPTGSVRIEAPIPGTSFIGVEVPNNNRTTVSFRSLISSEAMKAMKSKLAIVLGKDVGGVTRVYDIAKMPHLLVAGSTGSGKSVFLHNIIFSILYRCSPQECKFIMIDPKRVEMIHYADIPHLMTPVVTDIEKSPSVFKWAVAEMDHRYKLFEAAKARNIDAYNEKSGFQALPYIVIIVDELAEIMVADPAGVEKNIIRLGQLARATGIHLILAVQRPSTNIITGVIKANIPARVAFNVTSQIDSRVIIDQPGAEKLLGKGDMLFVPPDMPKPARLQGAFVSDKEIAKLVNYLKSAGVAPEYKDDIFQFAEQMERSDKSVSAGGDNVDDLFNDAIEVVTTSGKASASLLQRRLAIGYARAARILDELEAKGIISPANGAKPREVLQRPVSPMPEMDFSPQPYDESEEPVESIF